MLIFLLNFGISGWLGGGGGGGGGFFSNLFGSMNVYMHFTLYESSVFILATSTNSNFNFHIVA